MAQFTPPGFRVQAFNCPFCDAYAKQYWNYLRYESTQLDTLLIAICSNCSNYSIWLDSGIIHPMASNVPLPNLDLPKDIIDDYNEARNILANSPRGSAALLRLAIQKLCAHLGESGENINSDIANLVKKGLPVKIQQSMDILRVVGNNAVHPGQIDLKDDIALATSLFGLINLVAEVMISQPKHVGELYNQLPKKLLEAIDKRDNKV